MPEKRAKICAEHRQKLFYERLLRAWRNSVEDKNQKFVIYKAYTHLKNYPLEVRTITDLRQIHGIGETLAVRCSSAWEKACAIHSSNFDLQAIKKLSDEDLVAFMNTGKQQKQSNLSSSSPSKQNKYTTSNKVINESTEQSQNPKILDAPSHTNGVVETNHEPYSELSEENVRYVSCEPSDQAEILLIADTRENHGAMRGNTVVDCLTSSNYRVEGRTLSIGDYLWVLRKIDGTEVVLDWVVERKTWQDLQQSIRLGRYEEQKQRLLRAPMKNRVYLVEGTFRAEYRACEQALATTMVMHGFMIQRTKSPKHTAHFLCRITDYLKTITATRQITGISYESLQALSKKESADTVKDMWIRQLMVCPGMSCDRAQQVANRFPSMSSMIEQYSQVEDSSSDLLLSTALPGVNRLVSTQMRKFFSPILSGS